MISEQALDAAVATLAAIPYFPADEGTRAAIQRALTRHFKTPGGLRMACDKAVDQMASWRGIPALVEIANGVDEGGAFYSRLAEADRIKALPSPPDPVTPEERAAIDALGNRIKELAKRKGIPKPTKADREVVRKLHYGGED